MEREMERERWRGRDGEGEMERERWREGKVIISMSTTADFKPLYLLRFGTRVQLSQCIHRYKIVV